MGFIPALFKRPCFLGVLHGSDQNIFEAHTPNLFYDVRHFVFLKHFLRSTFGASSPQKETYVFLGPYVAVDIAFVFVFISRVNLVFGHIFLCN